ncbi:MAG: hypothetical protein IID08_10670 [Candidatus Hydrogenedentes bacterium]|nr:hypothetical protein [Candidatus Hydrogenedentota bacterium]
MKKILSAPAIALVALCLSIGLGSRLLRADAETAADAGAASVAQSAPVVHVDVTAPAPRELSAYGFFKDGARQIPNEGVLPYDLNSQLFSDYTVKHRFIWMPPGVSALYHSENAFSFPVGTVIIKTFSYLNDIRDPSKGERIIETRLLVHRPDGWDGLPYVWNDDRTEAYLKVAGTTVDAEWIHYDGTKRTNNYIVPNKNECKSCHKNADVLLPIGPKARNLNRTYPYEDGPANQLLRWTELGYLVGAPLPKDTPRLAVWNDASTGSIDARARAWLEINCMHCHNPDGPANTSGLDLRYTQRDPVKWGIMKPPVAAGRGAGDRMFDIVPGKPDESILMYRLESVDPGVMMPELPRRLVDEEGVALIRKWIASLEAPAASGD